MQIPVQTPKYAAKVSVWASISTFGKLSITFYDGNLNQYSYQSILEAHLYPAANRFGGRRVWVLLQDGAPCHRAHSTKLSILQHAGEMIEWPAASPDINPIENVWALIKAAVARRLPQDHNELRACIMEEWHNLDNSIVSDIALSMHDRVIELINEEGGYIHY